MRRQRVQGLRRLVARNYVGIKACCGDDLVHICEECVIKYNLMHWGLRRLAVIFSKFQLSDEFVWLATSSPEDGTLCTRSKSRVTFEVIDVRIAAKKVDCASEWWSKGAMVTNWYLQ